MKECAVLENHIELYSVHFAFRIQGVNPNIRVGIHNGRAVGVVDDHAGLAAGGLLHLLHRGHVHGDILAAAGFGIVGGQLGGLGHGVVRGLLPAAGNDDMAAVDLGGMAPDVVLPGQLEG